MASTYELIIKAVDNSTAPLKRIESSVKRLDKQASRVSGSLKVAGGALAAFITGSTVRSIVNTTARFEDLEDTLAAVTGSAKSGSDAFAGIQKFATKTQFGIEELTNTFIKLKSSGLTPSESLLTTFTDAAAVTTDQLGVLNAMTEVYTRTLASGSVELAEFDKLQDRGLPVYDILKKKLGVSRDELSKFGKQAGNAAKVIDALSEGINERFGGATQAKLDNLSTGMSNFGIAVTVAAAKLGAEFGPELTKQINQATKFIESNDKLIEALGGGLSEAIKISAGALSVLAQNIDLVRNAAIAYIGIRFAASFTNLVVRMSSAVKASQGLAAMFGTMGKTAAGAALRIPLIGGALMALKTVALGLGPALLNPFVLVSVAAAAAVTGGLLFFQDSMVQVGKTSASVGEVTQAVFNVITKKVVDTATNLGQAFLTVSQDVIKFFKEIPKKLGINFQAISDFARTSANNILNTYVAAFTGIVGIAKNFPNFFMASFQAIVDLAGQAVNKIINVFGSMGTAISLVTQGEFKKAFDTVRDSVTGSLGGAITDAFKDVPNLVPDINYDEIFAVDRLGQAVEVVTGGIGEITGAIKNYVVEAAEPYIGAIEQQIIANRVLEPVIGDITKALEENKIGLGGVTDSTNGATTATTEATTALQRYNAFIDETVKKAQADVEMTGFMAKAKESLQAKLDFGTISLQEYKKAMANLFPEQKKDLTATQQSIKSLKEKNEQIANLIKGLGNISELAKQAGVDEDNLRTVMQSRLDMLQDVGEKSKTLAQEINDSFKTAGDSLASSLASGLAKGKVSLNSFKDFFNQVLEDILQAIIRKNITGPLVAGLTGGGGGGGGGIGSFLGSFFGTPTVGAPMGGLDFSSIPFFAKGGPIGAGKPAIVGEKGPELFMPTSSGQIMSNSELNSGSGDGAVINFNINAIDTQTGVEFLLENKKNIIGMVSQGYNQRGRQGITS